MCIRDRFGFNGVMFICPIEDSTETGVATLTIEQNAADSDTGMTALTGASATATSAADDDLNDKLLVVDVFKPTARYVQAVRTSADANIAFSTLTAVLYGPNRVSPVATHATVAASTIVAN